MADDDHDREMSPVTYGVLPPWWCMWKRTLVVDSPNWMVTLRGSDGGCLNRAEMLTGAVMTLTPEGTTQR